MSYAQLTPEQPPPGLEHETTDDARDDSAPATDELKQAQARRLELLEQQRAADEGMLPLDRRARIAADEEER